MTELDLVAWELQEVVGPENLSRDPWILQSYVSRGIMELRGERADIVVRPGSVEEIVEILKIANKYRIQVTPRSGGISGGAACPVIRGGILLDLSRMDRILEVDEDSRYVVVEPGVTSGQIWEYFRENHPRYIPPIPDGAPPSATLVGDALDRGFTLVTSKYGPQADIVLGMEVVLPTGEIIRTGSWALRNAKPFYKWGIGPDLGGLFLGSQGTLGVVTKMALKIFPKPEVHDLVALWFEDPISLQEVTLEILKHEIGVMVQGGNWYLVIGRRSKSEVPLDLEEFRSKKYWIPPYMMNFELMGDREQVEHQRSLILRIADEFRSRGFSVEEWKLPPIAKKARLQKPNKIAIPYASHEAGFVFMTWYLPWKDCAQFIQLWEDALRRYGFTPIVWVAAIEHGRQCIGMPIVCFDSSNPEEFKKVEDMDREMSIKCLDRGWFNYRPNAWINAPLQMQRAPEYFNLLRRIKELIDPNNIMRPGRMGFGA